jgi:hypothetical protein
MSVVRVREIAALSMPPPDMAIVRCVDEKRQIPVLWATAARKTHSIKGLVWGCPATC